MSDTTGKTVTFREALPGMVTLETENDGPQAFLVSQCVIRITQGLATVSRLCSPVEYIILESPRAVIAKFNAALNPPGPGDVTWNEVRAAILQYQKYLETEPGYTIACKDSHLELWPSGYASVVDRDGNVRLDWKMDRNPIAAITSLMPKPDPRDELQELRDFTLSCLIYLRGVKHNSEIAHKATNRCDELITRAEKLEQKP